MAAGSERLQRIDASLSSILVETDFLPNLLEVWDRQSENARVDWSLEWRDLMARLENLGRDYRDGILTREQRGRFRELLGKLKARLPVLRWLDLDLPSVSLDAEVAA